MIIIITTLVLTYCPGSPAVWKPPDSEASLECLGLTGITSNSISPHFAKPFFFTTGNSSKANYKLKQGSADG